MHFHFTHEISIEGRPGALALDLPESCCNCGATESISWVNATLVRTTFVPFPVMFGSEITLPIRLPSCPQCTRTMNRLAPTLMGLALLTILVFLVAVFPSWPIAGMFVETLPNRLETHALDRHRPHGGLAGAVVRGCPASSQWSDDGVSTHPLGWRSTPVDEWRHPAGHSQAHERRLSSELHRAQSRTPAGRCGARKMIIGATAQPGADADGRFAPTAHRDVRQLPHRERQPRGTQ